MSNYIFSASQRYAIYVTHGEKCYLCKKPVDFRSFQVDHIVPEYLLTNPIELNSALTLLRLPTTFDVNSYENWLPSCPTCNQNKSNTIFDATPLIQLLLQNTRIKANEAKRFEQKTISNKNVSKALAILQQAFKDKEWSKRIIGTLSPLLELHEDERNTEMEGRPIKISAHLELISDTNGIRMVKGPYGTGGSPSGKILNPGFECSHCGQVAWSGARCVNCGYWDHD